MAKINESLRVKLESSPHILFVYFNSKGEWVFNPNKHYLDRKTREQVLKMEVETDPEETKEEIEVRLQSETPVKKTKK